MNEKDYLKGLQALLPIGDAWPREKKANLTQLLSGIASRLCVLEQKAVELIDDIIPSSTVSLLPDWERVTGLPDNCTGQFDTLSQRRDALLTKLSSSGGQSIAFFMQLAKQLGYHLHIEEFRPFRMGFACAGDALNNHPDFVHTWRATIPDVEIHTFNLGVGCAGEPLRSFDHLALVCFLKKYKPAHTLLLFNFSTTGTDE